MRQWPVPISVHDIQVFLGMAGYYSRFVQKYADKAAALTDLLKKRIKWEWSADAYESFEQLSLCLVRHPSYSTPNLIYPLYILSTHQVQLLELLYCKTMDKDY